MKESPEMVNSARVQKHHNQPLQKCRVFFRIFGTKTQKNCDQHEDQDSLSLLGVDFRTPVGRVWYVVVMVRDAILLVLNYFASYADNSREETGGRSTICAVDRKDQKEGRFGHHKPIWSPYILCLYMYICMYH